MVCHHFKASCFTKVQTVQASFSAASHGSLDSVDDEVDIKLDDDLKAQIEQMSLQNREENTLTQIEVI